MQAARADRQRRKQSRQADRRGHGVTDQQGCNTNQSLSQKNQRKSGREAQPDNAAYLDTQVKIARLEFTFFRLGVCTGATPYIHDESGRDCQRFIGRPGRSIQALVSARRDRTRPAEAPSFVHLQ